LNSRREPDVIGWGPNVAGRHRAVSPRWIIKPCVVYSRWYSCPRSVNRLLPKLSSSLNLCTSRPTK